MRGRAVEEWVLTYEGYEPDEEGLREALCTLGNGYFATRGALPESTADGVHYPGTYAAGVYNRLATEVAGRMVENESLVNAPNWLPLSVRPADGEWFDTDRCEVLDHHLELDMHRGLLTRRSRLRDEHGRILGITQRRFVSQRDPHLAGLETTLVAENWSGRAVVRSALDGTVRNSGVERYNSLDNDHLVGLGSGDASGDTIWLEVATSQSGIRIAEAARTRVFADGEEESPERHTDRRDRFVAHEFVLDLVEGGQVIVEKLVSLFTSRDVAGSEPGLDAREWVSRLRGGFDEELARHIVTWGHDWDRVRIDLGFDHSTSQTLRLHLFHLLQTVSNNTIEVDAGVPARGLHGEAYRGHIFWDELFIFPFLSLRLPELTRAMLRYRYRRLEQARRAAAVAGYAGAMFPWQSASNGREETQTMHLNPKSGRWLPDASHLQRHVNAAIVYNVWQYYSATGDLEFLRFWGAEMVFEIARFWASIATYDHVRDRYEIRGVMGPDEYHEGYPDRDGPGIDNNAYTNLMATWCLCRAFDVLDILPPAFERELREKLGIDNNELDRWGDISRKMLVCFHDDGIISQFEGYEHLDELDWDAYRARYGDIHRLDRILEAEGDSPNRYKLTKQADVMMLFYLLSASELCELLTRLGYACDPGLIPRNIAYYEQRTAHGSTLSSVVLAWVHARYDRSRSWHLFTEALRSDIDDSQGGTTKEGIHLGAMAGTVDLVQRCYTGLELRPDVLALDPVIPPEVGSLTFDIRYRGHLVHLEFSQELARVRVDLAEGAPITVSVRGVLHEVSPGQSIEVAV